jgi:hypothetical protein
MSKIYLFCVATGRGSGIVHDSSVGGDVMGFAIAEDGTGLARHLSSDVSFSKHDMGLTSDWKHEEYEKHYPNRYELEWVDESELDNH